MKYSKARTFSESNRKKIIPVTSRAASAQKDAEVVGGPLRALGTAVGTPVIALDMM